jgi:hypothetical protein
MNIHHSQQAVTFHTDCLQDDITLIPSGPGALAVMLLVEFRIHSPFEPEPIRLPPGMPLVLETKVGSLPDAAHKHLLGSVEQSDLRLGVSLFLTHDPAEAIDHPFADVIQADIDGWIGANTAFVFWPGIGVPPDVDGRGFFDGVALTWTSRQKHSSALN